MTQQEETIYKGEVITLKKITEKETIKEVVFYPKSVAVLPQVKKDKIILIKQYRLPAGSFLWEIPAGKLEQGETPKEAAQRELREETGYMATDLKKLAEYYVSPGYSTEYQYLFLAQKLKRRRPIFNKDKDEKIKEVRPFSLKEVLEMMKEKKIIDLKTTLAIRFLITSNNLKL